MKSIIPLFQDSLEAQNWLNQFPVNDRLFVQKWLDRLMLVDADTFRTKMLRLIKDKADLLSPNNPVTLYIERELKNRLGKPQYAFHEKVSRKAPLRHAYGPATKIKVIQALRTVRPEYGSESIIANFATQFQRENRDRFIINAGPDTIRATGNEIH